MSSARPTDLPSGTSPSYLAIEGEKHLKSQQMHLLLLTSHLRDDKIRFLTVRQSILGVNP